MGLLDDAIREHLELKRRRGADAEEVTRQEQEALGAPQRAEFAAAAPAATAEPAPVEDAPAPAPEPELGPEPVPEAEAEPEPEPERDIPLDQATVEYTPPPLEEAEELEEPPAPPQDGEEDVLEETPDFLQETPEHDRLWFEQKPPRDFDLDR
jgi:hypothetical protein